MAGTTANYSFPYPTSSDLAKNGASAMQSLAVAIDTFISGSAGSGKLFNWASDATLVAQSTTGTAWAAKTDCRVLNFTVGKSGVIVVTLWAAGNHGTSGQGFKARVALSGGITTATNDITLRGTSSQASSVVGIFDATAGSNVTATLEMASTDSGTCTINSAEIYVMSLG